MNSDQYQYKDMAVRPDDPYANAKYGIIADYLKNKKPLDILNAGCGSGELSFLLALAGHKVLGIDVEQKYIDLAAKNTPKELDGLCSFQNSSIENFSRGEKFDAVVAHDVLEHIKDDSAAALKLAGLVRPGGALIFNVPAIHILFL